MPCPDRSLCISSFDPVRLGFGGENPNEFRSAPGPTHGEGCYNAWCLLFPQLQTPHLALKTQSSTSSELEMCEKTEAAVPVLGSFTLYSTHPKPPEETRQRAWRMVTCCGYPSQKWHLICQTSEDGQIYQVYYTAGMKQELCSGTCLNNLLLNPGGQNLQQPVITILKDPAERKTSDSQDAQDFWILLVGFVQNCPGFWLSDIQLLFWFPWRVPCLIYKLQLAA